jgi:hypothetical protein
MSNQTQPLPARSTAGHRFTCVTCQFPIDWKPTFHVGLAFCCAGCAISGPCTCSYDERGEHVNLVASARICQCDTESESADSQPSIGVRTPAPIGASEPTHARHWLAEPIPVLARR